MLEISKLEGPGKAGQNQGGADSAKILNQENIGRDTELLGHWHFQAC